MTLKTAVSLAALTIALGFASEAIAQTSPPAQRAPAAEPATPPKAPVPGQILVQDVNTIMAKQDLIGQTVYAPDKAKIGSISDLILSKDGKTVDGFLIGVGGFLGIGEKNVAIDMSAFEVVPASTGSSTPATSSTNDPADVKLKVSWTKDQLKNAPDFKYYQAPARTTGTSPTTGMAPRTNNPAPAPR
jgi:sporulation protein YlmC with PRC-barrel domain